MTRKNRAFGRKPPPRHAKRPPRERAGRPARAPLPPHAGWIYGTHTVLAALANPERVCHRLLLSPEAARTLADRLDQMRRARADLPAPEIAPREAFSAQLGADAVHQGVALLAGPALERDLGDIARAAALRESAVVLVLDQVEDPRNVGAILRSAAAFGALAVVTTERHAPQQTAALAKAASGALEIVPLVRITNLVRGLAELKAAGFWIAGLDMAAERTLAEAALSGKIALVLGAEGKGLRRLTRETCDFLLRIPMARADASLNVSTAAAIALYALTSGAPPAANPKL